MGYLISWWSLSGVRPLLADVRATLCRYDVVAVVGGLARISAKLDTWKNSTAVEADREMVASLFPPDWVRRIEGQRAGAPNALVFHRITLLFLVKEALQYCTSSGQPIIDASDVFVLSQCFLCANDLVLGYTPTVGDSLDQLMASLMPFYELIPQESFPEDLVRNILLFEIVLPTLKLDPRYIDFPTVFGDCIMSYRLFCFLTLAAALKPMTAVSRNNLIGDNFFLTKTYFSNTSFPTADVERFLALVSTNHESLRADLQHGGQSTDMGPIQRRPLLRLDDGRFLVLDASYLLDKCGAGLFWTLREFLTEPDARGALQFMGVLLEHYAHWFWLRCYQGIGTYTPNVHFPNGDEAFDAVLVEAGTLIAIEYKSGMLSAEAKHSFEATKITDTIDRKYVKSAGGARKGAGQLQESLRRFLNDQLLVEPNLTRSQIHTIHPVIIAADPALTGPLVAWYLDRKLDRRQLRSRGKGIAVAPLQLATFTDFERLLPYTAEVSFTKMLEVANRTLFPSGNLRQRSQTAISGITPGRDLIEERWETFRAELSSYLHTE